MNIYKIQIGDTISVEMGKDLARHFGLLYLVDRLEAQPENYKAFVFDGCSMLPDQLMGIFTHCDWKDITYLCCLPHDLCYGYGRLESKSERLMSDMLFKYNLISRAKMREWQAECFLGAVRIGGTVEFGFNFSWGFANVGGTKYAI